MSEAERNYQQLAAWLTGAQLNGDENDATGGYHLGSLCNLQWAAHFRVSTTDKSGSIGSQRRLRNLLYDLGALPPDQRRNDRLRHRQSP